MAFQQGTNSGLRELALFAGAGGGILGGKLLGWKTVCAVEINAFCARRLMQRQNEGHLPPFPIWDDVCTFNGREWKGCVDVVSGGFPCQDISCAGKGEGISGKRSGLWSEMARIIGEVRPRYVLVENSPMLTIRGLGTVLGDLAEMGFDARWGVLGVRHIGGPHKRDRIWVVGRYANTNGNRLEKDADKKMVCEPTSNTWGTRRLGKVCGKKIWLRPRPIGARPMGVGNGVAEDVDRIKAIGNGQVPQCMALAWTILGGGD
jgi:DNA (cytosine-5)-methyltransferase 1